MAVNLVISKTAEANIVDLIKDANPSVTFEASDLSFGTPTPLTGHATGKNTSLTVEHRDPAVHSGSVTITYNRLTLTASYPDHELVFSMSAVDVTESDVLDAIALELGLRVEEIEFEDPFLAPIEPGESTLTLKAIDNSLIYVGQEVVTITWSFPLSDKIVETDMDGFEPPFL